MSATATIDRRPARSTATGADWADVNDKLFAKRFELLAEIDAVSAQVVASRSAGGNTQGEVAERELRRLKAALDRHTGEIVIRNYGLVRKYVQRFVSHSSAEDTADFEAAARVGLVWAITTYDPAKGKFSKWAHAPIKREVHRIVNQLEHPTLSNGDFAARPRILKTVRDLGFERPFSAAEVAVVAKRCEVSPARVAKVLNAPAFVSINQSVLGGDDTHTELGDLIEAEDADFTDKVASDILYTALEEFGLSVLTDRERFVLVRREGADGEPPQVLQSIGEMFNVSREAARQQQLKALAKLAHPAVLARLVRSR